MTHANRTGASPYGLKTILRDFRAARELELPWGVRVLRRDPSDETFSEPEFREPATTEFYALSEEGTSATDNELAIEQVVTLLWLFKPGPVWVWFYFGTGGKLGFGSDRPARPMPKGGPEGHVYELSAEECDRFEQFAAHFDNKTDSVTDYNQRYLSRALERFEFAAIRERDYLTLTDLVIGLEGLLVEKGPELSYKLALRTALLTGRSDEERLEIFLNMKRAYGFRSKYVHGEEVKPNNIGTLHEDVRRYFANAVVRFLDLPQEQPESTPAKERSRRYLDELALRHETDLRVDYPEWWDPLGNAAAGHDAPRP